MINPFCVSSVFDKNKSLAAIRDDLRLFRMYRKVLLRTTGDSCSADFTRKSMESAIKEVKARVSERIKLLRKRLKSVNPGSR